MPHTDLNSWYLGWGWCVWAFFIILMFSNIGTWGYTYRIHQKFDLYPGKDALDILNRRYAAGEILQDEYNRIKAEIKHDHRPEGGEKKWSSQASPA